MSAVSPTSDRIFRNVRSTQRRPRMLLVRVTESAGTYSIAEGGADISIAKNGTGDVTVTFTQPFSRSPIVNGTASQTNRNVAFSTLSSSVVRVLIQDLATPSAAEGGFHLMVVGFDSAEVV